MKKRATLLLLGGLVVGVGFVTRGFSESKTHGAIPLGDTKFLSAKPVVGFTADAAREALGTPHVKEAGGCALPIPINGESKPLVGEHWGYSSKAPKVKVELHVCIVKGYVIAQSSSIAILENGVISVASEEHAALALAKKLMSSPEDSAEKPLSFPFSSEEEIEI